MPDNLYEMTILKQFLNAQKTKFFTLYFIKGQLSHDFLLLSPLIGRDMQNIINGDHSGHLRVQIEQMSDF